MQYAPGDFFGELALMKNIPRQANIKAKSDCVVITLERGPFVRMLGPLEKIINRQSQNYVGYNPQK